MCGATLDIEAHSQGGIVAAYGITQASSQAQSSLRYFIPVGSPLNGTPLASIGVDVLGVVPFITALLSGSATDKAQAIIGSVPILGTTLAACKPRQFPLQIAPPSALLQ